MPARGSQGGPASGDGGFAPVVGGGNSPSVMAGPGGPGPRLAGVSATVVAHVIPRCVATRRRPLVSLPDVGVPPAVEVLPAVPWASGGQDSPSPLAVQGGGYFKRVPACFPPQPRNFSICRSHCAPIGRCMMHRAINLASPLRSHPCSTPCSTAPPSHLMPPLSPPLPIIISLYCSCPPRLSLSSTLDVCSIPGRPPSCSLLLSPPRLAGFPTCSAAPPLPSFLPLSRLESAWCLSLPDIDPCSPAPYPPSPAAHFPPPPPSVIFGGRGVALRLRWRL